MPNILTRALGRMVSGPAKVSSFVERGVSGTPVWGGYIRNTERNWKLSGRQRYVVASDILTNISIVAAGVRYFLNLIAKPKWKLEPADDSAEAQEIADFYEFMINDMVSSWSRIVRRSGMFKYHGFGIGEWTAKKITEGDYAGRVGLEDIEQRPQYTIERWGTDDRGTVTGVWQRSPQTGQEIWLPRSKIVYLVDDMMSDSPEGLGWWRSIAEPAERLKRFQELETIGYERNFAGTPIGRVPYSEINQAVASGALTQAKADEMIGAMEDFCRNEAKQSTTHMILDSAPYESVTGDGTNISSALKWGVELLKGDLTGMEHLGGDAGTIMRIVYDIARIIGIESLLTGSHGSGSLALSKSQTENLALVCNSTLIDMAQGFDRDVILPVHILNGFPPELKPKLKTEDVAFRDVEEIAAMLQSVATAGAPLAPDDPAINELRDLAGIPRVPDEIMAREQKAVEEAAIRPPTVDPATGKLLGEDPSGDPLKDGEDPNAA